MRVDILLDFWTAFSLLMPFMFKRLCNVGHISLLFLFFFGENAVGYWSFHEGRRSPMLRKATPTKGERTSLKVYVD